MNLHCSRIAESIPGYVCCLLFLFLFQMVYVTKKGDIFIVFFVYSEMSCINPQLKPNNMPEEMNHLCSAATNIS